MRQRGKTKRWRRRIVRLDFRTLIPLRRPVLSEMGNTLVEQLDDL